MASIVGQEGIPPVDTSGFGGGGINIPQLLAWTDEGDLAITDGNVVPVADNPDLIAAIADALQQPGAPNIDPDFDVFGRPVVE